jgi:oxygen-independent coproporphyrinogen-3 oxidase
MIALGTSGISDVAGAYAQNHKRLASYYQSVDEGELPVERGVELAPDDRILRYVITELMCNSRIRFTDVEDRFDIDFADYFSPELEQISNGLVDEGMVSVDEKSIRATELGSIFIRNVAMTFDAYLQTPSGDKPVFSRTV